MRRQFVAVCVVAAGLAGNYAYQRYRRYNDQSELINHAVEEIVSADESVVQLDSLIGDPMAEVKKAAHMDGTRKEPSCR